MDGPELSRPGGNGGVRGAFCPNAIELISNSKPIPVSHRRTVAIPLILRVMFVLSLLAVYRSPVDRVGTSLTRKQDNSPGPRPGVSARCLANYQLGLIERPSDRASRLAMAL